MKRAVALLLLLATEPTGGKATKNLRANNKIVLSSNNADPNVNENSLENDEQYISVDKDVMTEGLSPEDRKIVDHEAVVITKIETELKHEQALDKLDDMNQALDDMNQALNATFPNDDNDGDGTVPPPASQSRQMHKDTNYGVPGDDKETDDDGTDNTFDTEASNKQMSIEQDFNTRLQTATKEDEFSPGPGDHHGGGYGAGGYGAGYEPGLGGNGDQLGPKNNEGRPGGYESGYQPIVPVAAEHFPEATDIKVATETKTATETEDKQNEFEHDVAEEAEEKQHEFEQDVAKTKMDTKINDALEALNLTTEPKEANKYVDPVTEPENEITNQDKEEIATAPVEIVKEEIATTLPEKVSTEENISDNVESAKEEEEPAGYGPVEEFLPSSTSQCNDLQYLVDGIMSPWHDHNGKGNTCAIATLHNYCTAEYFNIYDGVKIVAKEACCGCGGGYFKHQAPTPGVSEDKVTELPFNNINKEEITPPESPSSESEYDKGFAAAVAELKLQEETKATDDHVNDEVNVEQETEPEVTETHVSTHVEIVEKESADKLLALEKEEEKLNQINHDELQPVIEKAVLAQKMRGKADAVLNDLKAKEFSANVAIVKAREEAEETQEDAEAINYEQEKRQELFEDKKELIHSEIKMDTIQAQVDDLTGEPDQTLNVALEIAKETNADQLQRFEIAKKKLDDAVVEKNAIIQATHEATSAATQVEKEEITNTKELIDEIKTDFQDAQQVMNDKFVETISKDKDTYTTANTAAQIADNDVLNKQIEAHKAKGDVTLASGEVGTSSTTEDQQMNQNAIQEATNTLANIVQEVLSLEKVAALAHISVDNAKSVLQQDELAMVSNHEDSLFFRRAKIAAIAADKAAAILQVAKIVTDAKQSIQSGKDEALLAQKSVDTMTLLRHSMIHDLNVAGEDIDLNGIKNSALIVSDNELAALLTKANEAQAESDALESQTATAIDTAKQKSIDAFNMEKQSLEEDLKNLDVASEATEKETKEKNVLEHEQLIIDTVHAFAEKERSAEGELMETLQQASANEQN